MADLHPSDSPDVVGPTLDVARIQTLLADAAKRLDEHSKVESRVMCGCNHVAKKLRALSASLTQLQEERDDLLGRLAVMFPLSNWADRHRALSSPSSLPREGANG